MKRSRAFKVLEPARSAGGARRAELALAVERLRTARCPRVADP